MAACTRCSARALLSVQRAVARVEVLHRVPALGLGSALSVRHASASSPTPTPTPRRAVPEHEEDLRRIDAQGRALSTSKVALKTASTTRALGQEYPADDYTNVPSSILSRLAPTPILLANPTHPLSLLQAQIQAHLASLTPSAAFTPITPPQPIVSADLNFSDLGFPPNHPGRSPTDTYYLNRDTCLRTHTSAHEVEVFRAGHTSWLLAADVYRRDEIDASHYPIFHQMEGARIFSLDQYEPASGRDGKSFVELECEAIEARLAASDVQIEVEDNVKLEEAGGIQPSHDERVALLAARHLKAVLNSLVLELFGERHRADSLAAAKAGSSSKGAAVAEPLRVRWISATFPFTTPSYEVEVWFRGKWLEILGSGVVMDRTLQNAGVKNHLGWAFGLGLERIAMVLYSIPDIRLFWSTDERFLRQFASAVPIAGLSSSSATPSGEGKHAGVSPAGGASQPKRPLITFTPYSRHPPCYKDVSFWLPKEGDVAGAAPAAFHENELCEIVRDTAADLAEDVSRIDEFVHPKTGKRSLCYRINYRSMDRNLENDEVNALHAQVLQRLVDKFGIEIR
ncbi:phenylalanyl-tRNA synthetase alpha subunit, mitochondrial [Tilletia horrida]|uniref:Phenylalanine--tRNA ligase, mitochondrial n=1 Tax=Tilletia horrida TaxID=155126 RepID=A0AAN6GIX8_9BASI|nr:phenylalanyl-tRNA synthetase alpha subunit, mitochondrial [Tilletia horrida]